jgi:rare lipoprotein A
MKLNNIIKNLFTAMLLLSSSLYSLDKNILAYKDRGIKYYPKYVHKGFTNIGKASWYGNPFHGRLTASGERYNMYGMTAAHKTYALGTRLKVTNLRNRKSVIVRVNDRGPFHSTRKIDLSYGAAKKIGMIHKGVSRVKIEVLSSHNKRSQSKKNRKHKRNHKYSKRRKYSKKSIKKITKKSNFKKKVLLSKIKKGKKVIKKISRTPIKRVNRIQIASFSTKKQANIFKRKNNLKNVVIVKKYIKSQKRTVYKVVIKCTPNEAKRVFKSKKFAGAYRIS